VIIYPVPGRLKLVTAPASEPVTTAEAKAHLRVETAFTADDDAITLLAKAARELCEAHVDRSFVNTTWDYVLDEFPTVRDGKYRPFLPLPKADVQSVTSVSYVDDDGDTVALVQGTDYEVLTGTGGGIYPTPGTDWPEADDERHGALSVRFVAGYGSSSASVPGVVRASVLMTLAHLYEHRGDGQSDLPPVVQRLLGACRWGTL
jgi:uncharacterized phiE125 gp8 family phage protein